MSVCGICPKLPRPTTRKFAARPVNRVLRLDKAAQQKSTKDRTPELKGKLDIFTGTRQCV